MLIGMDLLKDLKANINFATNEVTIGDQTIVASSIKAGTEKTAGVQVRLIDRVKIPAYSTIVTMGQPT